MMKEYDRLLDECQVKFGLHIQETRRIDLGWMNDKWDIKTDQGHFVVKKYHSRRYKNREMLGTALSQQQKLHMSGFPCPMLLEADGEVLHTSDSGDAYIVMQRCDGSLVEPGAASARQMYDLGRLTGIMHCALNDGTLAPRSAPVFDLPEVEDRLTYWREMLEEAERQKDERLAQMVELQISMLGRMDLPRLRERVTRGWAHRDLWMDNLLFHGDKVSAVLDFDRLNDDYPELDVARAIMSGAYRDSKLDLDRADSFLQGYREHRYYRQGQLLDSLHLLWMLESEWWIRPGLDEAGRVPNRFAEEIVWLAGHEEELEDLVSGL